MRRQPIEKKDSLVTISSPVRDGFSIFHDELELADSVSTTWQEPSKAELNDELLQAKCGGKHKVPQDGCLGIACGIPAPAASAIMHPLAAEVVHVRPTLFFAGCEFWFVR